MKQPILSAQNGKLASIPSSVACQIDHENHDTVSINPARLLDLLNKQLSKRFHETHPSAQIDFTSLACLLGSEDRVELCFPSDALNWAVVMLPPPRDYEFLPLPPTATVVGKLPAVSRNVAQRTNRIDHTVVIHAVHQRTGTLRSVVTSFDDTILDDLSTIADAGTSRQFDTSRRIWQRMVDACPTVGELDAENPAEQGSGNCSDKNRTPVLSSKHCHESDDAHTAGWVAAGRRWFSHLVPSDPQREESAWRLRAEWTQDAVVRSILAAPLDKQVDEFDAVDGSLFKNDVEDEDEESQLNVRVLSLLRRLAADEPMFGTTAAYNWVHADNRCDHAIRIQMCCDVVVAPRNERGDALSAACEAFTQWQLRCADDGA